jgi:pimeloyl-ACP methyl ester carboxylesterase
MSANATNGEFRKGQVRANGLEFAYLEAGDGPLVVLLHGFPDHARTWAAQIGPLAAAGYRVVAPFLRGYPPTEIPADGRYDLPTLASDLSELIRALDGEPAYVVGHDWGAATTYATMAMSPSSLRRAVVIALGHPATFVQAFEHPSLLHHLFHFWLFQLGPFAHAAASANDHELIDYLWRHWSPGHDDGEHVQRVKRETLTRPGALEATLAYYPALLNLPVESPGAAERILSKTTVPTLAIFGGNDPVRALSEREEAHFSGPYRQEIVEGAGHFVHRERPDEVTRLLLDWFAADDSVPAGAAPGARFERSAAR